MRIMLINPPIDSILAHGHVSPVTAYLFYNSAPLGILYIAAVLEQHGHQVAVIDAAAQRLDVAATVRATEDFRPELVGVGSFTVTFETTKLLGQALRDALPGLPLVLGSYHVTLVPQDAMAETAFDVGVLGEGEHAMLDLVDWVAGRKALEDIPGLVYRKEKGGLRFTAPRKKFHDLDQLPFPARHLVPPNIYRPVPVDDHAFPKFAMVTSRGCPHACAFCQKSRSGFRSHSAPYVVDEIEHLVRDFGVRDIAFVDSLFCANKRRVHAVCDEIIRRGLHHCVSWTCSSRVEVVDKALLEKMKSAGCWRTRFGIESGNDEVLEFISKGITKDKIRDAITWADQVGLRPKAFLMVGHMPDTRETIEETIAFAKSLPLHDITVQINTLLPETPQMEIWKREGHRWGRVINQSDDEKSFWEPTFVPWGLEPQDLVELHRKFYREFYFRPVTLARHAEALKNWRDVAKYVQASSLFSFLFFNAERPSLRMLRDFFASGRQDIEAAG
ncbi:MAG: B12-binding domain-containing radical SAM protein [Oligoflexia bacterium]|nr:B12-binding domain-containing radical SAM protein [Oligoflexia bacterium]